VATQPARIPWRADGAAASDHLGAAKAAAREGEETQKNYKDIFSSGNQSTPTHRSNAF
jgi:hypothetical protein